VSVSGAVSPAVAHQPVVLQKLVGKTWHTLAKKGTGKGGSFAFKVKATGKPATWKLRVTRAASSKASAVVGKTLTVHTTKTAYKITSTVVSRVVSGNPIPVTGKVSPKTTGKVYLQVLNGTWKTIAAAKLSGSAYSFNVNLPVKSKAYSLRVMKPFNTKIAQGESPTRKVTVYPKPQSTPRPTVSPRLSLAGQDDALLGLPGSRLVFSTVKSAATPAQTLTFTNSGNATATVSGLAIQGADASSFAFAPGQPTTLTIPAGGSATVTVLFTPTAATGCPKENDPDPKDPNGYLIGDSTRSAAVVFTTNDTGFPGGSAALAGINSCDYSSSNEPVLDQVLSTLGYTDKVTGPTTDRRFIGPKADIPGTDEVTSPYFVAADPAQPVTITPLAQYSTSNTRPYHPVGWFSKGAAVGTDGTCTTSVCHELYRSPAEASLDSFTQNQKLLPQVVGTESFTPGGAFGLYFDEFTNVDWSDDTYNIAHQCSPSPDNCTNDGVDIVPTTYLHNVRIYPAYGPNHVAIPHTFVVAVDVSRLKDKNNDFQDLVVLLRNADTAH
jgi:hypothetical protein